MAKNSNKKNKKDNKYNAENEIIIGVTTKPKEKVRVEKKKTTRTNPSKNNKVKSNDKKKVNSKNKKTVQTTKNKTNKKNNKKVHKKEVTKEEQIRKLNSKKIIISIIILLFIALGGTIYYLTTPAFNVADIEIYGNERNSAETYISLSKIDLEITNIFSFTKKKIQNNLKENSYVESVIVERKLPNTLQIYITERKVAYQIKNSANYIYLDNQGYILEIAEEKKDVPILDGFKSVEEGINVGKRLKEEDLIKLNNVAKIINYCKYNAIENKITNIDITDSTNYIVYFKEDKKTVYLGDASNLSERLSMLKTILKNEEKKEIEIFMNGDLNNDDVYIRYID